MYAFLKNFKLFINIGVIIMIALMASHMETQGLELTQAKQVVQQLEASHKADSETIKRLEKTLEDYSAQLQHLHSETDKLKEIYANSNKTLKKKISIAKKITNPPEQYNQVSEILFDDIVEYKKELGVE